MKKQVFSTYVVLVFLAVSSMNPAGNDKNKIPDGIVLMEAESTSDSLGLWVKKAPGDEKYLDGALGEMHLEFTGNGVNGGKPSSPLTYRFTAPTSSVYRLLIRCHKRLEGYPGDKCNDGWVKMDGDFTSANEIPVEDLKDYEKFFGGSAVQWGWAQTMDWQGHIKREALYNLKQGEEYTITIAGRSIRWNIDCVIMFDTTKFSLDEVKKIVAPDAVEIGEWLGAWELKIEGFSPAYYDIDRNAIAINTVNEPTDKWAAATRKFHGKDGIYNITFNSLLETDGECSYKVFVGSNEVLSLQNPRIHGTDTKEYSIHSVIVENILINRGDTIRVEFLPNSNGLVPEKDAFGFARARWTDMKFDLVKATND